MKIAFYAPLKSPNHSKPSGDRLLAQLFIKALTLAGHSVELSSELRSFDRSGNPLKQKEIMHNSEIEAQRILQKVDNSNRPEVWFTYHSYHKAPDWIGPTVCKQLEIPYVIAEASISPKQATGQWKDGYHQSINSVAYASGIININKRDNECLQPFLSDSAHTLKIQPFLDTDEFPSPAVSVVSAGALKLCAVAMMRAGDKYSSWAELAQILGMVKNNKWSLTIIGDGVKRTEIQQLFKCFGSNVSFRGELQRTDIIKELARQELLIWPGINEAFGMVYLEAHAAGRATLAGRYGGVEQVVQHGRNGLLYNRGNTAQASQMIDYAIGNRNAITALSSNAEIICRNEHTILSASRKINDLLSTVCGKL